MAKAPPTPKGKPRPEKPPIIPMRADQYTRPLVSMWHERLSGRVIIAWSRLDACLQGLIWTFLNLSMSDGKIITSRLDAGLMIQMLRALGTRNLVPERLQPFLDV